jgi:hypothetical protein
VRSDEYASFNEESLDVTDMVVNVCRHALSCSVRCQFYSNFNFEETQWLHAGCLLACLLACFTPCTLAIQLAIAHFLLIDLQSESMQT